MTNTARIALVTGGAGGIGADVCRRLAGAGHHVLVADLPAAGGAARALAGEIGGAAVDLDITDPTSVEAAATSAGPVDVLVNCAGWDELRAFVDTDEEFLCRVIEINLAGPMRVTRAFLPGMLERNWGRIVSISSDAGRVGSSLEAVYSGAKGGVIAFMKTIAREVARRGVTANSICPGPTDTPLLASVTAGRDDAEKVISAMARAVPIGRLGRPEDIGPAVAFLCSDDAGFITGQTLSVSGGLTMN
jgi:2-hydroxycyclohexanecarboxyl-CoA dehydrogenase